jgi:hypothetical protein
VSAGTATVGKIAFVPSRKRPDAHCAVQRLLPHRVLCYPTSRYDAIATATRSSPTKLRLGDRGFFVQLSLSFIERFALLASLAAEQRPAQRRPYACRQSYSILLALPLPGLTRLICSSGCATGVHSTRFNLTRCSRRYSFASVRQLSSWFFDDRRKCIFHISGANGHIVIVGGGRREFCRWEVAIPQVSGTIVAAPRKHTNERPKKGEFIANKKGRSN